MARSGSLPEGDRRLAEQRRDDERLARERRRKEKEQERTRQLEHDESRQQAAEESTAAVEERLRTLDEVLTSVLTLPPLSFDRLLVTPKAPGFDPGPLGVAVPAPHWGDFAPARPGGLGRFLARLSPILGRTARYDRLMAEARSRFAAAEAGQQRAEAERRRALAVAKARYDRKVTEERARAVARNAYVARRRSAFAAGDQESVEWFVRCVLSTSRYPDGFPREHEVAYRPQDRTVAVESELPPQDVVPTVRAYRYVKAQDVVEPLPRPDSDIRQRYRRLISCVALRILHEIFSATPPEVVAAVAVTGRVSAVDRATGRAIRPHLLSVSADRAAFDGLVLAAVDPVACLASLNGVLAEAPGG